MTNYLIAQLAYIAAANARVEGMKAENMQRQRRGESLAYTENQFAAEAEALDALAMRVLNNS